jgi:hypothetical protein
VAEGLLCNNRLPRFWQVVSSKVRTHKAKSAIEDPVPMLKRMKFNSRCSASAKVSGYTNSGFDGFVLGDASITQTDLCHDVDDPK